MPTLMMILCPHCKQQLKGPVELQGKKVRCKACSQVFVVQQSTPLSESKSEASKGDSKGKSAEPQMYQMTEAIRGIPRCPHCAGELDSEDAVICLHCGYNQLTGQRISVVKAYSTTSTEVVMWRLPGIIGAVLCLVMLVSICLLWLTLSRTAEDGKEIWWVYPLQIWGSVIAAFVGYLSGRMAVTRLILETKPPEDLK
jgi:hypothetical protein